MFPFRWSIRDWTWAIVVLTVGFAWGLGAWWLSPVLLGHSEPWDAGIKQYLELLFLGGFFAALFHPRAFWVAPLGIYAGQFVYCSYLMDTVGASLWPLGMVMAVFSIRSQQPAQQRLWLCLTWLLYLAMRWRQQQKLACCILTMG